LNKPRTRKSPLGQWAIPQTGPARIQKRKVRAREEAIREKHHNQKTSGRGKGSWGCGRKKSRSQEKRLEK